jgi:hypothetical protein
MKGKTITEERRTNVETEKKKRGRPSIYERMPKEKMIAAYKTYKTARAAARALGISHGTLIRVLKENDVKMLKNDEAKRLGKRRSIHTGTFAKWLKENEGDILPRDFQKLQKMSGCSKNSISSYFYRRRRELKDRLKALPDLRNYHIAVIDDFGETHYTDWLERYEYLIDKFSLKVKMLAKKTDGTSLLFDIHDIHLFTGRVMSQGRLQELSSPQETPASNHPSQRIREPLLRNETEYFPATFRDSLRTNPEFDYNQQERTSEGAANVPAEPDTLTPYSEEQPH